MIQFLLDGEGDRPMSKEKMLELIELQLSHISFQYSKVTFKGRRAKLINIGIIAVEME